MRMRRLIEAVKMRPVLYDPGHEDYTRHKEKDLKWGEVAEEASLPSGAEAKSTWMKLRQSLRDALRRQQKCMRNGVETFKLWKYQKQMEFLLPFMSSQLLESSHFEMDDSETSPHNYFIGNDDHDEFRQTMKQEPGTSWNDTPPNTVGEMSPEPAGATKRTMTDAVLVSAPKRSRDDPRRRMARPSHQSDDSLYYFFMSMYETTRNMPQSSQLVVKNNIFRVVTSVEASLMNIATQPDQSAPQWPSNEMSSDNEGEGT